MTKFKTGNSITYEDCVKLFEKARDKQKGKRLHYKNTFLRKNGDNFNIRLWNTDIITINPQNVLTLNSGGYRTHTTKYRINEFISAYVHQAKNAWYIGTEEFFDGIQIDTNGTVLNPLTEEYKKAISYKKKILDKLILRYCDGFQKMIEEGKLKFPSGADCLYCNLTNANNIAGKNSIADVMGDDHIIAHLREQYYVPSLLFNAIKRKGYANPVVVYQLIKHENNGITARNILKDFFRKKRESLLKLV